MFVILYHTHGVNVSRTLAATSHLMFYAHTQWLVQAVSKAAMQTCLDQGIWVLALEKMCFAPEPCARSLEFILRMAGTVANWVSYGCPEIWTLPVGRQ